MMTNTMTTTTMTTATTTMMMKMMKMIRPRNLAYSNASIRFLDSLSVGQPCVAIICIDRLTAMQKLGLYDLMVTDENLLPGYMDGNEGGWDKSQYELMIIFRHLNSLFSMVTNKMRTF